MTSTVIAILIAIPQPMRALGGEMFMAFLLSSTVLLLLLGFLWGMYLYVPSALLALLLGALAGWSFLTKAGVNRSETAADTSGT